MPNPIPAAAPGLPSLRALIKAHQAAIAAVAADTNDELPIELVRAEDDALLAIAELPCNFATFPQKLRYMLEDQKRRYGPSWEMSCAHEIMLALDLHLNEPADPPVRKAAVGQEDREALLDAYNCWLDMERRFLAWERCGGDYEWFEAYLRTIMFVGHRANSYHGNDEPSPSSRAELVLAAVGCNWREREASR